MLDPALQRDKQIMLRQHLQARGIDDPQMWPKPWHRFPASGSSTSRYGPRPTPWALGIACGQTISQPYIVALMTQALALRGGERVLEIGTGSGYQTAILAALAREVVSIERHEALSQQAARRLVELGYGRVKLVVADGTLGWPAAAPYDRILVAAAAASARST